MPAQARPTSAKAPRRPVVQPTALPVTTAAHPTPSEAQAAQAAQDERDKAGAERRAASFQRLASATPTDARRFIGDVLTALNELRGPNREPWALSLLEATGKLMALAEDHGIDSTPCIRLQDWLIAGREDPTLPTDLNRFLERLRIKVGLARQGPQTTPPVDESAFIPANLCLSESVKNHKALLRILKHHPEIRTRKPSPQRLEVHAGDWRRHLARQSNAAFNAENIPAFLAEANSTRDTIRGEKEAKGTKGSYDLTSRLTSLLQTKKP